MNEIKIKTIQVFNCFSRDLKAVLIENERIRKFGFTQTELDRNKEAMLKSM